MVFVCFCNSQNWMGVILEILQKCVYIASYKINEIDANWLIYHNVWSIFFQPALSYNKIWSLKTIMLFRKLSRYNMIVSFCFYFWDGVNMLP